MTKIDLHHWTDANELWPQVSHLFNDNPRAWNIFINRYARRLIEADAMIRRRGPYRSLLHRERALRLTEELLLEESRAKAALI